jgi:predicted kinase
MQTLTIVRGLPGSGKTTIAKKIKGDDTVLISADDYFETEDGYCFDISKISEAHLQCQLRTFDALVSGHNVIVHNTFYEKWMVMPYAAMASILGTHFSIITCDGGFENTHGCPKETVDKMRDKFEYFSAVDVLKMFKSPSEI